MIEEASISDPDIATWNAAGIQKLVVKNSLQTDCDKTDCYPTLISPGDSFSVLKPGEFEMKYLPQRFRHSNMVSFIRQVKIY